MKIRSKLILSMSVLIVFILLCLLAVTHVQFYIVRDFAYVNEKSRFTALQEEFEQYYAAHNESWAGVSAGEFEHSSSFVEIALVVEGQVLYRRGTLELIDVQKNGMQLKLQLNEHEIGRIYAMNTGQYKTFEFKSLWYGILPSIVKVSLLFTCIAALFIILLLSWTLTSPIRKIIKGIDRIKQGKTDIALPVRRKDEFGAISRALQEMYDSLTRLEQSRKQLLSDAAHELKTPLMIMQGELELALELQAPVSPERLSSLLDEVLRLSRLVHDVLDLAKMEAGRTELRRQPENIVLILQGLMEQIQFLADDKQIIVSLHTPGDRVTVSVEKHRIVQALYNILTNAIQYTSRGGQVHIRVEGTGVEKQQDASVRIIIEDNGYGIPEEDLPHIFNRFYRSDDSRTRANGGTGLGLAIAQQNILLHQGTIEVHSEVGKGSRFTISLPAD
ncbi:sensory transduction histidine kinase [Paenibacillus mucilaginosus 3016]|uniref:histidine kinase n=1 Tax=Paenibacillus mucilaginosus 3016 TaxID=1116391 RepID=H6NCR7_9BACL|nr:sensory transduction histidine kinase [Paenibacillus mucilaginosus 3016]WDM31189.1 HAMP domain-containing histidine kinase [Paenibacillus mucilaginosus]WFA22534.1 HAMP domain-containing histidine kinase [Paenibacillus mucilaginosus]